MYMYLFMYIYIHVCIYIHVYIRIYIYIKAGETCARKGRRVRQSTSATRVVIVGTCHQPSRLATKGQIDGFLSQLPYKNRKNRVAYVGD